MPAYFGHWVGAINNSDFKKEITDLKTLGQEFREAITWRLGEEMLLGMFRRKHSQFFCIRPKMKKGAPKLL